MPIADSIKVCLRPNTCLSYKPEKSCLWVLQTTMGWASLCTRTFWSMSLLFAYWKACHNWIYNFILLFPLAEQAALCIYLTLTLNTGFRVEAYLTHLILFTVVQPRFYSLINLKVSYHGLKQAKFQFIHSPYLSRLFKPLMRKSQQKPSAFLVCWKK